MPSISPERIRELLAAAKLKNASLPTHIRPVEPSTERSGEAGSQLKPAEDKINNHSSAVIEILQPATNDYRFSIDKYGHQIELNQEQIEAVTRAASGESIVLIGAAGSGKTTTTRQIIQALIDSGRAGLISNSEHKYLIDRTPGIVSCAYTRRAVANMQKSVSEEMRANVVTIHKLLEYQPVYETVTDPETGEDRTKMIFQATRNAYHPLPSCIKTIIIEEASMVSVELFQEILNACPHSVQFIFLGDIQQLPPVFGSAILGFKMLELPTIELTQIYRQALESPIIRLAHRILSGNPIPANEFPEWKVPQQLTLHPWKKKLDADLGCLTFAKFITNAIDVGAYDPESDMILCPFNKSFGTDEINKHIAQHLAKKRGADVYEIIAGFNKYYYSIGDRVLVEKEDAQIIDIYTNPSYTGAKPAPHSPTLDYWGAEQGSQHHIDNEMSDDEIDAFLDAMSSDDGDRVRQCSHTIVVRMVDTEQEIKISTASEVNTMLFGYCLTVHKSQGSEWRKVFLVLHQSHATMIQRELMYTAVTRAKEELYVICEPNSFEKGITSQRIKGNSLAEKAEWFKGKVDSGYLNGKNIGQNGGSSGK